MADTPKPARCPFCGDRSCEVTTYDDWARVECHACGAQGPVFGNEETPIAERIESALGDWKLVSEAVWT
jgi:transcription elongation factor Elf1